MLVYLAFDIKAPFISFKSFGTLQADQDNSQGRVGPYTYQVQGDGDQPTPRQSQWRYRHRAQCHARPFRAGIAPGAASVEHIVAALRVDEICPTGNHGVGPGGGLLLLPAETNTRLPKLTQEEVRLSG